jgi:hypothetical protein
MSHTTHIPPLAPRHPGLRDQADWKTVYSVPKTHSASMNAEHWHALLRLFSWQIQRIEELESEVAKLRAAAFVPVPATVEVVIPDASP